MNGNEMIAHIELDINGPAKAVWQALTNKDLIRKYMNGTEVESSWNAGSEITWDGEWQGKNFHDHGKVLETIPGELLKYSHISEAEEATDKKGRGHIITITLTDYGNRTYVKLSQENNSSDKEIAESQKNWNNMLQGLKKIVENKGNKTTLN